MVRLIQQTVRPEMRIVVMSATLDTAEAAAYLGDCAVVASEGRLHPVTIRYEPPPKQPIAASVADAIRGLDADGDVLAFLPGVGEIRQTASELESWARDHDVLVVPLYGDLPAEQQDIALVPQSRRKVVLATNVAETSITVEGVVAVIDTGLARQLEYDPAVGMDRLKLLPISRASADQRAGRAGRTRPGVCIRLWNEIDQRSRTERTEPEIRRVDLAGPLLQLLALGEGNGFPWLEAPKPAALDQARILLDRLDATHAGNLTDLGRAMARLPVHPRLARFLLEAARLGCAEHAALAAALLSERDPFLRDTGRGAGPTRSDLIDRAHAVAEYERSGRTSTPLGTLHVAGARFVLRARDQLLRTLRQETDVAETATGDEPTMRALLAAYPDRLARRREGDPRRGVMVGGRGVKLLASGVVEGELFLCLDVDAGATETLVRQASAVDRDWIEHLETAIVVSFDETSERVVAHKQVHFEDLVIEESQANSPSDAETSRVLVEAATTRLDRVLPEPDSAAGNLLVRFRWLREYMPELELPVFDDADLREALGWLAAGKKSFADLRRADWAGVLMGRLTPRQRHALDREAPERIEVPSGSHIAVAYEPGKPPVLAVRIQEVFGLADTPRVAGGRVKVLLHLLAPNYRPQQVTDDLASFWANTYPIVRKELRARYPKHAWPEDPTTAPAQRGPKRR
jgi:ATP-dependent helicase HrpB